MAKSGAKGLISAEPLDFSDYPVDRAERRIRFIEEYLSIPRGQGAGDRFELQPFQLEIIRGAYADGVRTGLVSCPRASGKSMLAAALTIAEMAVGPESAEVLCVASDARQASIILKYAKRMIELSPELSEHFHIFSDRMTFPQNDAVLLPLSADPASLHGYDPSLLIVDELHVVGEATWVAATSMTGKRPESLTLAISTPADSADSVMWSLVQHGRREDDPSFYFKEFAAPVDCDLDDREAWRIANPALTCPKPFLAEDGLASARKLLRPQVFQQLRLGQWVSGVNAWLPFGAWEACKAERPIVGPVCLAFDGSASRDSTALVGCTLDGYIWLEQLWENPGDPRWRVPRSDVDNAVDLAFSKYDVLSMAVDPWGWRSEMETWEDRYGEKRVIEWNTGFIPRMAPATDRLYQAVVSGVVTNDGDPRLAAHIEHCTVKKTPYGDVVVKDKKNKSRKIDAGVGAILAFDRAEYHRMNPEPVYESCGFD